MGLEESLKDSPQTSDAGTPNLVDSSPLKYSTVSKSKRGTHRNLLRFLKTAKDDKATKRTTVKETKHTTSETKVTLTESVAAAVVDISTDQDQQQQPQPGLTFPETKDPSKAHINLSAIMLHISTMVCKHLVYWGGIYKDHYITVEQLRTVLQEITARDGPIKTPDLSTSIISPKNTSLLIIDARRPDEYAVSHIPGAVNIHSILSRRLSRCLRNVDFDTPIVVYCAVGLRSGWTSTRLRSMGFKNVKTLEGAYYRWAGEGKPIVGPKDQPVKEVLPQHFLAAIVLDRQIRAKVEKTKTKETVKQEITLEAPKTEKYHSAPLQHDHLHDTLYSNDSITW